jgi:L-ascorbate 6-phosphate lactonase
MIELSRQIRELFVPPGSLGIFWLGQAGFVFKTPAGKIIYTDPYLTGSVQEALPEYGFGFKRLTPSLLEPEEVEADYVISTHSHADHFDVQAVPVIARSPRPHFIGAPDCRELYLQAGAPPERFTILHAGERLDLDGVQLSGVYADHGELAPDALGLWFDFAGITVWQVGDSAYRPDAWQELFERGVDVLIPPINGAFGNLNEEEAARLAHDVHARVVIPCHFWTFPLHGGDPAKFLEACKQHAPEVRPLLMAQGEGMIYQPNLAKVGS